MANAPVSGTLFILGNDESMLEPTLATTQMFLQIHSTGQWRIMIYELLLNSRITNQVLQAISANLKLMELYPAESSNLSVEIEGPELPPQG